MENVRVVKQNELLTLHILSDRRRLCASKYGTFIKSMRSLQYLHPGTISGTNLFLKWVLLVPIFIWAYGYFGIFRKKIQIMNIWYIHTAIPFLYSKVTPNQNHYPQLCIPITTIEFCG
jgi:hypothetical protein